MLKKKKGIKSPGNILVDHCKTVASKTVFFLLKVKRRLL